MFPKQSIFAVWLPSYAMVTSDGWFPGIFLEPREVRGIMKRIVMETNLAANRIKVVYIQNPWRNYILRRRQFSKLPPRFPSNHERSTILIVFNHLRSSTYLQYHIHFHFPIHIFRLFPVSSHMPGTFLEYDKGTPLGKTLLFVRLENHRNAS